MAEFEELDCACAGLVGEGNPDIDLESIDVLVEVIRELHHKKKILDDKDCKTIRYSGARHYGCYFELTFALLAKPHEKVKTAIKVLAKAKNPVIDNLQIPQFLHVCLDLHQLLNHEDVREMKRRESLKLKERIIHVVCMKDFAAVKELAGVMGTYGFSDEKDWLLVYVKLHEEGVLTDKDVQDLKKMIEPFLQRIWRLFRSKDPDALRKAGDIFWRHASSKTVFPALADIQESQYLSGKEYSSLFDHPSTSLLELVKIAIAKDSDTSKGIAAVLQKHGYDEPSKTVIVVSEFVAEEWLSVGEGRNMIDTMRQHGGGWISMLSHAAAAKTSEVSKQMAKILDAHGFTEEAAVVRRRETVGDPMPSPQPGRGTVGDPRLPPQTVEEVDRRLEEAKRKYEEAMRIFEEETRRYEEAMRIWEEERRRVLESSSPEPTSGPSMLRTSDEEDLEKLCWIPFGIQTLSVGEEGGIFLLEPEDKQFAREDQIFLTIPKNSVNMDKCKKLTIRYAILMHGPFVLDEGYKLASPVVYINFNPEHILQTSCLDLQLPHWANEKEKGCIAVAPHSVNQKQQYKFELRKVKEGSSNRCTVISIPGHATLYSIAYEANYCKRYMLLPVHQNSEKGLRVFVVYQSATWSQIVRKKMEKRWTIGPSSSLGTSTNIPSTHDSHVTAHLPLNIVQERRALCNSSEKIRFEDVDFTIKCDTADKLKSAVKDKIYPPSFVYEAAEGQKPKEKVTVTFKVYGRSESVQSEEVAQYLLKVYSRLKGVDPLPRPPQPPTSNPDPEPVLFDPKYVFKKYDWRDLKKDVKDMLTRERVELLAKQYDLINEAHKDAITGHIGNDDYDRAASCLLEYFEKNRNGEDLLEFCKFLRDEARAAGGNVPLTRFADKLKNLVKYGKR